PEKAHKLTIKGLKTGILRKCGGIDDPRLSVDFCGLSFPNPIGLAAGFDKNAEALGGILNMGFGFAEVGTVTPKPQDGNPTPRVFRHVPTGSVINRMGFPNGGVTVFQKNIVKFRASHPSLKTPVGLNIGMNKDQTEPEKDYTLLIRRIGQYADYLTVNVSSPNTPGLRDLQAPEFLKPFLTQLIAEKRKLENNPPLLVKLAPDLSDEQISGISKVLVDVKIDGVILTNTTLDRPDVLPSDFAQEKGGLSGALVKDKSTETISKFYKQTKGQVPIIGIGGISTVEDVVEKVRAGASLVQLYTGLIYNGPGLPNALCKKLVEFLEENAYKNISDLVGEDHRKSTKNSSVA
ncbi:MAG: quinone-dependent dihydroorotate dehydrogenase, partial [Bdellovibrionales bacterium]